MINITKSENDPRIYTGMVLENGMKVLHVYDKTTSISSASVSVGIGTLEDTLMGMAHFLEHMLFMGSIKYPKEDYYHKFITLNGGSSNAYTAHDHTCYYFNIKSDKFKQALDVFGQFFISPLFDSDAVSREIKAVDSEHRKNINVDGWRQHESVKLLIDTEHPYSRFSTGSLETLNKPDILEEVKKFYKKYYSSNNMSLVVYTNEPFESMKEYIIQIFNLVPLTNGNHKRNYKNLFNTTQRLNIVPISDKNSLNILWEHESISQYYDENVINFLSNLIGHEGKESLFNYLLEKGYCDHLYAGQNVEIGNKAIFNIAIELTDKGFNNINEVISAIYTYIDIVRDSLNKKIIGELYNELIDINEMEFKNSEISDYTEYTSILSSLLVTHKQIPMRELLLYNGNNISKRFNNKTLELLTDVLSQITEDKMRIIVSSKDYTNVANNEEEYYGIKYMRDNIGVRLNKSKHKNKMDLPVLNKYIVKKPQFYKMENNDYPIKVEHKRINVWMKYDDSFNVPKAGCFVKLECPNFYSSLHNYTRMYILTIIIKHVINTEKYYIEHAGYKFSFDLSRLNIIINIYGYPEKISEILKYYFSLLTNNKNKLKEDVSKEKYDDIIEMIKKSLRNKIYSQPYSSYRRVFSRSSEKVYYDYSQILRELENIDYNEIFESFNKLKSPMRETIVLYGNINNELVDGIVDKVNEISIETELYKPTLNDYILVNTLKDGEEKVVDVKSENPTEINNLMTILYQIGNIKVGITPNWNYLQAVIMTLDTLIDKEYFDDLRTKRQTGYIAKATSSIYGCSEFPLYAMQFLVQSYKFEPEELNDFTDKFIRNFYKELLELPDEEFETAIDGCIETLKHQFESLDKKAEFYATNILNDVYVFDVREILIDTLKKLNKEDVINFFKLYLLDDNKSKWNMYIRKNIVGNKN